MIVRPDVLSQMMRAHELSTGPRVMVGFGRAWIVACWEGGSRRVMARRRWDGEDET